jgi:hypothetical protein
MEMDGLYHSSIAFPPTGSTRAVLMMVENRKVKTPLVGLEPQV